VSLAATLFPWRRPSLEERLIFRQDSVMEL
jgi:hypothetical protein